MNVLYLNTSGQIGGAETSLTTLMESLRELHPDWRLSLLLGEDGPLVVRAGGLGVEVRVLPLPPQVALLEGGSKFTAGRAGRVVRAIAGAVRYRRQLRAAIREMRPDLIHTNGFKMHLLLASISRRGLECGLVRVCHMHDYVDRRPVERWLLRIGSSRIDQIVANSDSVAAELRAVPISREKVVSIHNGVRMDRFSPVGESLNLDRLSGLADAPDGTLRVGLVGTFAKWKGHIAFLQALGLLRRDLGVRGYIVGAPIYQPSGSQYTTDELRAAAKKYCPRVEVGFTGFIERVDAAYRALDIVVHPSTEPEPFGMAILEAMACGKATVVSRGGGATEIFEDGVTALAHEPGDAAMLARQIERLAADAELRASLGRAGRVAVAARFQADVMGAAFAELYGKLAADRQAAAYLRSGGEKRCFA